MFQKSDSQGFSIICQADGLINQVLYTSAGLSFSIQTGQNLQEEGTRENREKMQDFFRLLAQDGAAYNFETTFSTRSNTQVFNLSGTSMVQGYFIVASEIPNQVNKIYEEFMLINNEQLNTIRRLKKQVIALEEIVEKLRDEHFERLNKLYEEKRTDGKNSLI